MSEWGCLPCEIVVYYYLFPVINVCFVQDKTVISNVVRSLILILETFVFSCSRIQPILNFVNIVQIVHIVIYIARLLGRVVQCTLPSHKMWLSLRKWTSNYNLTSTHSYCTGLILPWLLVCEALNILNVPGIGFFWLLCTQNRLLVSLITIMIVQFSLYTFFAKPLLQFSNWSC